MRGRLRTTAACWTSTEQSRSVFYKIGGIRFTRVVFISVVDQVIVVRLTASQPGSLSFTAALTSPVQSTSQASSDRTIRLTGKAPSHVDPNYLRSDRRLSMILPKAKACASTCC